MRSARAAAEGAARAACERRAASLSRRLLRAAQDHEWITVDGDIGTIGITNHAQEQLGDVVFVELPTVGDTVEKDDTMGAVESVKAASDIYSPVSGTVTEVNSALEDDPALVNSAAEGDGWMSKVKLSDPAELDDLMVRRRASTWARRIPAASACLSRRLAPLPFALAARRTRQPTRSSARSEEGGARREMGEERRALSAPGPLRALCSL